MLSKARPLALFEELCVRTLQQCAEAGLVDGAKVYVDSRLIEADASRDSVVKADAAMIVRIRAAYRAQERELDETKPPSARCEINHRMVSATDPDAPCVAKGSAERHGTVRKSRALELRRTPAGVLKRPLGSKPLHHPPLFRFPFKDDEEDLI